MAQVLEFSHLSTPESHSCCVCLHACIYACLYVCSLQAHCNIRFTCKYTCTHKRHAHVAKNSDMIHTQTRQNTSFLSIDLCSKIVEVADSRSFKDEHSARNLQGNHVYMFMRLRITCAVYDFFSCFQSTAGMQYDTQTDTHKSQKQDTPRHMHIQYMISAADNRLFKTRSDCFLCVLCVVSLFSTIGGPR
jgi:hypothetical protein